MHNHSILNVFCILLICAVVIGNCKVKELELVETYCEGSGWIEYRDEKCLKLIKTFATREQAQLMCAQESSPTDSSETQLVSIKSAADQKYLTKFVFDTSAVEMNVWIGAKREDESSSTFVWEDGSAIEFTNWADGSPTGTSKRDCAVMQSEYTRGSEVNNFKGKWRDVTCGQQNYIVCEKLQRWSFAKLQHAFLDTRKGLENTLDQVNIELNDTRKQLDATLGQLATAQSQLVVIQDDLASTQNGLSETNFDLGETKAELGVTKSELIVVKDDLSQTTIRLNEAENKIQDIHVESSKNMSVPIGFIYTQLPLEKSPTEIWPWTTWADVSSAYAGLFFRADGGYAEPFGEVQQENAPRLSTVYTSTSSHLMTGKTVSLNVIAGLQIPPSEWSNGIRTGVDSSGTQVYTHFKLSNGEVRPRNMAIRIWKRTA